MNIVTIKILGGIALWLSMLVFGLLPLYWSSFKTNARLISLSNCFCGGLFIAIGLVHILPEAHEALDEGSVASPRAGGAKLLGEGGGDDEGGVQLSYLICLMSYSAILFLDKVVFNNSDLAQENPLNSESPRKADLTRSMINSTARGDEAGRPGLIESNFKERISSKYKIALRLSRNSSLPEALPQGRASDFHEHDELLTKPKFRILKTSQFGKAPAQENAKGALGEELVPDSDQLPDDQLPDDQLLEIQNQKNKQRVLRSINEDGYSLNLLRAEGGSEPSEPSNAEGLLHSKLRAKQSHGSSTSHKKPELHEHGHEHDHAHGHHHNLVGKNDSIVTSIILLIAMGIHGFFALLAFGIEPSKTGTVNLFIALIIHKWSEALTVGRAFAFPGRLGHLRVDGHSKAFQPKARQSASARAGFAREGSAKNRDFVYVRGDRQEALVLDDRVPVADDSAGAGPGHGAQLVQRHCAGRLHVHFRRNLHLHCHRRNHH